MKRLRRLHLRDENGQTTAEYSVVLVVITPAIIVALALLSEGFRAQLANVASVLS